MNTVTSWRAGTAAGASAPAWTALRLPLLYAAVTVLLLGLSDWPHAAVLLADALTCAYLASLFDHRARWGFLLHPVVLALCSQGYAVPFLESGDGQAYFEAIGRYLDLAGNELNTAGLNEDAGLFGLLKDASFGVLPVLLLPGIVFSAPADDVVYLWQGCFHVLLCSLALTCARAWNVPSARNLLAIGLLSVVGPSFFDLGAAPTRHVVTFFGLLLLYLSYAALLARVTLARLVMLLLGLAVMLISKAQLLIPFLFFCVVASLSLPENRRNPVSIAVLTLAATGAVVAAPILLEQFLLFEETAQGGAATFGGLTELPVVGWAVKYVFAILAPFPWTNAAYFVATDYGGNWLLFLAHVGSSLTGLYIAASLLRHWRAVRTSEPELRLMFLFGGVMSLSILRGATGFHTYLLVYFPFFAPLLAQPRFRVSWAMPLAFVLGLDLFVSLAH